MVKPILWLSECIIMKTNQLKEIFFLLKFKHNFRKHFSLSVQISIQAPEPIEQWDKIFDATRDGPMCPQPTDDNTEISEDCLRLNIYTHDVNLYLKFDSN